MISILKFVVYFFPVIISILALFIGTSYSKKAREKFNFLKSTDGKKHVFVFIIIVLVILTAIANYSLDSMVEIQSCPRTVFEIQEMADRALWERTKNCGDRTIYNELLACFNKTKSGDIKRQIVRIEDDYKTSILVPRVDATPAVCQLGSMVGDGCTGEPVKGFNAENVLDHLDITKYPRCTSRARASSILRNLTQEDKNKIGMKNILKPIVSIIKDDPSLLVSKLALDRYRQFTEFSSSEVFDFQNAIQHYENNY